MAPDSGNQHQSIQSDLIAILKSLVQWSGLGRVFGTSNISDRRDDWTKNYRVPDVCVFLDGTRAERTWLL